MKIQAYMPVFNEADVLPHVLAHLQAQGIEHVHLIDGWSDDGSEELVFSLPLIQPTKTPHYITFDRFPVPGPSPTQDCHSILGRIEELAAASDADWIMYTDADEWRRSPRAGETLAQGIARVDAEGWNVIDYRVFAFFCTDDGWDGNPEPYFRYYNETDPICLIPNQKTWKNIGRVDLQSSGGHITRAAVVCSACRKLSTEHGPTKELHYPCTGGVFDYSFSPRICPERWVMKHYPYRTPEQARRKIETRIARRCHAEHQAGWGVHYDPLVSAMQRGFSFRWNPADLTEWTEQAYNQKR